MFLTLQDRLPKEFKLAGICTVAAANTWLRDSFIADYNTQFAVAADQAGSAFVADTAGAWREILCTQEDRTVGNDNTVKWDGLSLQLPPNRVRRHFAKTTERRVKRASGVLHRHHQIVLADVPGQPGMR